MKWKIQALLNKAYSQLEENKSGEGVATFENIVTLAPEQSEFYAYLGEAYFLNQEYDKAWQAFAQRDKLLLQADPLTPYLEGYRGCILVEKHEYEKARPLLESAVAKEVKEPEIYYYLGMLYMLEGKLAKAREIIAKIDSMDPAWSYRRICRLLQEITNMTNKTSPASLEK